MSIGLGEEAPLTAKMYVSCSVFIQPASGDRPLLRRGDVVYHAGVRSS